MRCLNQTLVSCLLNILHPHSAGSSDEDDSLPRYRRLFRLAWCGRVCQCRLDGLLFSRAERNLSHSISLGSGSQVWNVEPLSVGESTWDFAPGSSCLPRGLIIVWMDRDMNSVVFSVHCPRFCTC